MQQYRYVTFLPLLPLPPWLNQHFKRWEDGTTVTQLAMLILIVPLCLFNIPLQWWQPQVRLMDIITSNLALGMLTLTCKYQQPSNVGLSNAIKHCTWNQIQNVTLCGVYILGVFIYFN